MSCLNLSMKRGGSRSGRQGLPSSSPYNLAGQSAYNRHQNQVAIYDPDGSKTRRFEEERLLRSRTDWDLLKEEHQFIREEEVESNAETHSESLTAYGRSIAKRYEQSLFKEYALVDLKHYKSGQVALRWRTPEEVIDSIGSSTCGSLRCVYHLPPISSDAPPCPQLEAFELPFSYAEKEEAKTALVKVVCCRRCKKKLLYGTGSKARGQDMEFEKPTQARRSSKREARVNREGQNLSPIERSDRMERRKGKDKKRRSESP